MKIEMISNNRDKGRDRFFDVIIDGRVEAKINKIDAVNTKIMMIEDSSKTITAHWGMTDLEIIQKVLFLLRIKV